MMTKLFGCCFPSKKDKVVEVNEFIDNEMGDNLNDYVENVVVKHSLATFKANDDSEKYQELNQVKEQRQDLSSNNLSYNIYNVEESHEQEILPSKKNINPGIFGNTSNLKANNDIISFKIESKNTKISNANNIDSNKAENSKRIKYSITNHNHDNIIEESKEKDNLEEKGEEFNFQTVRIVLIYSIVFLFRIIAR